MRTVSIRPSAVRPVMVVTSSAPRSSIGISATPSDHRPVDGRGGQRDIERHAIVVRRERLQIGADLVATSPVRGDAVGADDREIDHAVLHQMAAGIVGDHGVRHAVLAELPGGERGALVARPRLVDPDMDAECRRRAP